MRVAPYVYLVASGDQGCALTEATDCNAYVFDSGSGLVLFDTGAGIAPHLIFEAMAEDGLDPATLSHAFLTHAHGDHAGGAAAIAHHTGCRLVASHETKRLLESGEDAISLTAARVAGVYPPDYVFRVPAVDEAFAPGARITVGALTITAIATPGHSLDHVSYLVEGAGAPAMVTGDAVMHSGRIIYQNIYDFDVRQSGESIRRLATFAFDIMLPGHGLFVRRGGRRHVDAVVARLDRLGTPRAIEFLPF